MRTYEKISCPSHVRCVSDLCIREDILDTVDWSNRNTWTLKVPEPLRGSLLLKSDKTHKWKYHYSTRCVVSYCLSVWHRLCVPLWQRLYQLLAVFDSEFVRFVFWFLCELSQLYNLKNKVRFHFKHTRTHTPPNNYLNIDVRAEAP